MNSTSPTNPWRRIAFLSLAFSVLMAATASYSVLGSTNEPVYSTFYACKDDRSGTLTSVSVDETPGCGFRQSLISWVSIDPGSLDDVYVNEGQPDAISTGMIQSGAITTDELADQGVTTEKLADHSVANDKLASDSVSTDKLQNESVTTSKLDGGSVTSGKLAANSVSNAHIQHASVNANSIDQFQVQRRVENACDPGHAIQSIHVIGFASCTPVGTFSEVRLRTFEFNISNDSAQPFNMSCLDEGIAINGGVRRLGGASSSNLDLRQSSPLSSQTWLVVAANHSLFNSMDVEFSLVCLHP